MRRTAQGRLVVQGIYLPPHPWETRGWGFHAAPPPALFLASPASPTSLDKSPHPRHPGSPLLPLTRSPPLPRPPGQPAGSSRLSPRNACAGNGRAFLVMGPCVPLPGASELPQSFLFYNLSWFPPVLLTRVPHTTCCFHSHVRYFHTHTCWSTLSVLVIFTRTPQRPPHTQSPRPLLRGSGLCSRPGHPPTLWSTVPLLWAWASFSGVVCAPPESRGRGGREGS